MKIIKSYPQLFARTLFFLRVWDPRREKNVRKKKTFLLFFSNFHGHNVMVIKRTSTLPLQKDSTLAVLIDLSSIFIVSSLERRS